MKIIESKGAPMPNNFPGFTFVTGPFRSRQEADIYVSYFMRSV
jgi:hypothetical protein